MPANIEHWIIRNRQSRIYALRESQSLRCIINDTVNPNYDLNSLLLAIDASRVIKDHDEVEAIRQAIKISSLAHRTILHHITALRSEAEVHALYTDACIGHGAEIQAYPPIVASGSNAAVLHYTDNNHSLTGRNLLCLDAGCEWACYASDITRTLPLQANGWPSKEIAEIYGLVERMQEKCIEMLGPGVRYFEAFLLADKIAAEGLMSLGILKQHKIETILQSGVVRAVFPHGLGHHMGLDVQ